MNRKVLFFLLAALVCLGLAPLTQEKFRWLPLTLSVTYAVLAVLTGLDARSQHRRGR